MKKKQLFKLVPVVIGIFLINFMYPSKMEGATATNNGSIFNTNASPFGGTVGWTNVSNVQTSNGVSAVTSSTMDNSTTAKSYSLEILTTGFGFTIPANAIINSVTVGIQANTSNGASPVYAYVPRMIVGGAQSSVQGGSIYNIGSTPSYINYTFVNDSSSGISNFPVTVAQVNASNFGVSWSIYSQSATATTVSVDHINISIDYTVPAAPIPVTDNNISSIRSTDAILTGTVTPNALATTAYFKWGTAPGTCSSLTGNNNSATPTSIAASGIGNWPVSFPITGLSAGTTYYYCLVATNSSGTNYGNVYQFTTTGSASPGALQSTSAQSGSNTNVTGVGTYNAAYSNPNNILASDGLFTTCGPMNYPTNNYYCSYLWTWGYGFNIPANATITGITVDLKGNGGKTNGVFDNMNLQLYKNAQSQTGYTGQRFPSLSVINQYIVAGGSNDLWGGTFTPAEINSANFGFMITNNSQGTWTESLDHFRATVYYTLPTTPTISSPPTQQNLSYSTITLGGNITSQGATAVDVRGVCYSVTATNASPQHGGAGVNCVNDVAGGTGTFSVNVTGLTPTTPYSFKAFAHNTQGYAYTSVGSFTTLSDNPTGVDTATYSNLLSYRVTLNGVANPNGFQTYGHFRVYRQSPTGGCSVANDASTVDGQQTMRFPQGTGQDPDLNLGSGSSPITHLTNPAFTYTIPLNSASFLTPNTQYWYCAYAVGGTAGTSNSGSSSVLWFITPDGPASPCDPPASGNLTVPSGAACTFNGTFNGVDAGSGTRNDGVLTVASGANLTISVGQQVSFGSLIPARGSQVVLARGATLRGGALFVHDKDRDGVLDSKTQYIGSTPSAATEFVRRNTISTNYNYAWKIASSGASLDCNPNSAYAYRIIPNLVKDADQDGYKTATAAGPQCVGAAATINGRMYYNDGTGPN